MCERGPVRCEVDQASEQNNNEPVLPGAIRALLRDQGKLRQHRGVALQSEDGCFFAFEGFHESIMCQPVDLFLGRFRMTRFVRTTFLAWDKPFAGCGGERPQSRQRPLMMVERLHSRCSLPHQLRQLLKASLSLW